MFFQEKRINHGFTLIELLVVISILTALTSIVMAALNGTRARANDTAIAADLHQLRAQMELYLSANDNYGTVYPSDLCPTFGGYVFDSDPKVSAFINALNKLNDNQTWCSAGSPLSNGKAGSWAVASPVSYSVQYWCVDSKGNAKLSHDTDNWLLRGIRNFIPMMYAMVPIAPPPPPVVLGGGATTPAACP